MNQVSRIHLVERVTCPYCWREFPPEDVHWISDHSALTGDSITGRDEKHRFLPSRFNLQGMALDEERNVCTDKACPFCHGQLPDALLQMRPLIVSVFGAPGSGKTFYLGAMLKRLDEHLDDRFRLRYEPGDTVQNQKITAYKSLFKYDHPDSWKRLEKTQVMEQGLYRQVKMDGEDKLLPIPAMFSLQPQDDHVHADQHWEVSRVLCLYDCAGEYFLPGLQGQSLVVDHLANSDVLLFVFDPLQEPDFRRACMECTSDPQVRNKKFHFNYDQSGVLEVAAERVRKSPKNRHRPSRWKYDRPLIVLVNKWDSWKGLLPGETDRWGRIVARIESEGQGHGIDLTILEEISRSVEGLLYEHVRPVVNRARSFADEVYFLPISSTGVPPTVVQNREEGDGENGSLSEVDEDATVITNKDDEILMFRAGSLNPQWVEIPILFTLSRSGRHHKQPNLIAAGWSGSRPKLEPQQVIPLRKRRAGG